MPVRTTKRRIVLRIQLDAEARAGLESISETTGMKTHVIATRIVDWLLAQDDEIRNGILESESEQRDEALSQLILRRIARRHR
jgi:hypothetical protein